MINNAVIGVGKGYTQTLKLNGVGFRANLKGKQLQLQLGFSHDIIYDIPEGIAIKVDKQTIIIISGVDKELVAKIAADIKNLKRIYLLDKPKGVRGRSSNNDLVKEVLKRIEGDLNEDEISVYKTTQLKDFDVLLKCEFMQTYSRENLR